MRKIIIVFFYPAYNRFCATGEGRFQFYTDESRAIHAKLHSYAMQKAASSGKSRSMPRRASEVSHYH